MSSGKLGVKFASSRISNLVKGSSLVGEHDGVRTDSRVNSDIPTKLWHFTSASGFEGIMQSQRLWVSSASSLNDQEEIEPGMRALRVAREQIPLSQRMVHKILDYAWAEEQLYEWLKNLFILSTTADADSLEHWENYANQHRGVAVALDTRAHFIESASPNKITSHAISPVKNGWLKVEYDEETQVRLVKDSLFEGIRRHSQAPQGEYIGESFRRVLSTTIAGSKFASYKNEQEYRYIIGAYSTYKPQINEVIGKEYMSLACFDRDNCWIRPLPLVEIRLGKHCALEIENVRDMLRAAGITECEVSREE